MESCGKASLYYPRQCLKIHSHDSTDSDTDRDGRDHMLKLFICRSETTGDDKRVFTTREIRNKVLRVRGKSGYRDKYCRVLLSGQRTSRHFACNTNLIASLLFLHLLSYGNMYCLINNVVQTITNHTNTIEFDKISCDYDTGQ